MGLEGIDERLKLAEFVIVADGFPSLFPDMLLGIQLWTRGWEIDQFQAVVLGQELVQFRAELPGRPCDLDRPRFSPISRCTLATNASPSFSARI